MVPRVLHRDDGCMNQTTESPTGPTQGEGPRGGDRLRDLGNLRRSRGVRQIAGVAGGIGRHFDIDPTLVRVLLVVLTFFGGAGLLFYVAAWIFVPEDGQEHPPFGFSSETRKVLLISTAAIGAVIFIADTAGGYGWAFGLPIPIVLAIVLLVALLVTRERRRQQPPPWSPPGTARMDVGADPESATGWEPTYPLRTETAVLTPQSAPPPVSPWTTTPAYVIPLRPRRTGVLLWWPTLALIAIGCGVLGLVDLNHDVPVAGYPAVALAVTGLMLVVGAFRWRPGGLIVLGLVSALALGTVASAEAITGGVLPRSGEEHQLVSTPATSTQVLDEYSLSTGSLDLDLSKVSDPAALGGRTIRVHNNAGRIRILVPEGLAVNASARIKYAGQIRLFDRVSDGLNPTAQQQSAGGQPTGAVLNLVIDARVGEIDVTSTGATP